MPHPVLTKAGTYSYETFASPGTLGAAILLRGASGPEAPLYREQAAFFAARGFRVLLPHFFDATRSPSPSDANVTGGLTANHDALPALLPSGGWSAGLSEERSGGGGLRSRAGSHRG